MPRRNEYNSAYNDCIVDNHERNSIVSRLARYAVKKKKKYVIILCQRIRHLKLLSKRLEDVPHITVFGEKHVTERIVAKKKFEKGKIRLLIVNQVFKKGVDIKRVDMMIDCAGLKSSNDAIQKFGRGVRQHIEKHGLLYFDLADYDPKPKIEKEFDGTVHRKYNSFHVAARRRKRAYKSIGIPVKDFEWDDDSSIVDLYSRADKFLRKEMKKSGQS